MRKQSPWARDMAYRFPVYNAVLNGHDLSVWQRRPGEWSVCIRVGAREAEIAIMRRPASGKYLAEQWAAANDPRAVRLVRGLRLGNPAWILASASAPAPAGPQGELSGV